MIGEPHKRCVGGNKAFRHLPDRTPPIQPVARAATTTKRHSRGTEPAKGRCSSSTSPCLLAVARTSTPTCPPPRECGATEGRPRPARRGWGDEGAARAVAGTRGGVTPDDARAGRRASGGESTGVLTSAAAEVRLTPSPERGGTVLP
jgi:hypothetical protein